MERETQDDERENREKLEKAQLKRFPSDYTDVWKNPAWAGIILTRRQ